MIFPPDKQILNKKWIKPKLPFWLTDFLTRLHTTTPSPPLKTASIPTPASPLPPPPFCCSGGQQPSIFHWSKYLDNREKQWKQRCLQLRFFLPLQLLFLPYFFPSSKTFKTLLNPTFFVSSFKLCARKCFKEKSDFRKKKEKKKKKPAQKSHKANKKSEMKKYDNFWWKSPSSG